MLIAQLGIPSRERNGDWYYRTAMPSRALAQVDDVWTVEGPYIHRAKDWLFRHADVLVINMIGDLALGEVAKQRRARGQVTVLEYNDDTAEAKHIHWAEPMHPNFLRLMGELDGVQFSTWALHRRYAGYAHASVVAENMIDALGPWSYRQAPFTRSSAFTIGWGGSMGHYADVRAIAEALGGWCSRRTDVRLSLMCDASISALFKPLPHAHRATTDIQGYYAWLTDLDVGLAPMLPTKFNASRSDIKFLEYGAAGVCPVLADWTPYHATAVNGENALFYDNTDGLIETLDYLYSHRDEVKRIARGAHATAKTRKSDGFQALLRWYEDLLPSPLPSKKVAKFLGYDGCRVSGRYISLGFGQAEIAEWEKLRTEDQRQRGVL